MTRLPTYPITRFLVFTTADTHQLDPQRPRARAVEFGHQDALPLTEHDFPAADLQRQAVSEQQRAQMRIGVEPVAVGMIGVVVQPLGVAGDHLFEEALDVRKKRRLKLVDEQRAGRVHRPEADETFLDVELASKLHDPVGEIDQLDALIGGNDDRLTMNRETASLRGNHLVDGRFANGNGRALAHGSPLVSLKYQKNDQVMLRKITRSGNR